MATHTSASPDENALEAGRAHNRQTRYALGRVLIRKECWALSPFGKVLLLMSFVSGLLIIQRAAYPFLAVTDRASSDILVVDGWIPTYTLEQVASEFRNGHYHTLLLVRGLYGGISQYDSGRGVANYMAETLARLGVPRNDIHVVFLEAPRKDRTFSSALAVKEWCRKRKTEVAAINVSTLGAHARRSRLLYEKAFGAKTRIGVIANEEQTYDPMRWWRSSEGVREVPFELIAYLYAKLFFSAR